MVNACCWSFTPYINQSINQSINQTNVFLKTILHLPMSQNALQKPSLKPQTTRNANVEAHVMLLSALTSVCALIFLGMLLQLALNLDASPIMPFGVCFQIGFLSCLSVFFYHVSCLGHHCSVFTMESGGNAINMLQRNTTTRHIHKERFDKVEDYQDFPVPYLLPVLCIAELYPAHLRNGHNGSVNREINNKMNRKHDTHRSYKIIKTLQMSYYVYIQCCNYVQMVQVQKRK